MGDSYLSSVATARSAVHNLVKNGYTGEMEILSGTIISTGSDAIENSGIMTIGTKDGEVDKTNPYICGEKSGLKATTNVKFYDGIIKGKTSSITDLNKIEDREEETDIATEVIGGYKVSFLVGCVRTITFNYHGGNVTEATRGVEDDTEIGELPTSKYLGKRLVGWYTQENGQGDLISEDTIITGDMELHAYWEDKVVAIVNGVNYSTINDAIAHAPSGVHTTIDVLDDSEENITVNSSKDIVLNLNGKIISNYNASGATIVNNGKLELVGGEVRLDVESAAIDNNPDATLIVNGTRIISTGGKQAIFNKTGLVEVKGNSYLWACPTGVVPHLSNIERSTLQNVSGGTIVVTGGTIVSTTSFAIGNEATLILGTNDGVIDSNSIELIAETNGVKNASVFSYYDGTIRGKSGAIDGTIDNQESNSLIITETVDGYEVAHLEINE